MDKAMFFPRYESYKDSGVSWIGNIPEHWSVLPFKALFHMSTEKNGKSIVGEMLSVSGYRGIEVKHYEYEEQKRSDESLVDYRVVRKGQLVVNTMWLNYAGLGVSDHEGYVSPAYRSYNISNQLHGRYAHYLMRSHVYVDAYTGQMQGIRPNSLQIKNCDFNKFPILLPKPAEQERITNFLEQKTAEIDDAVAKKQRLIELLNEQKTILINQAVTKGLNPDVPMRNSGVEWIGQVPEHWDVKKLKYYSEVQSGITLGKLYSGNKLISAPYLRVANVQDGYFKLDEIAELQLPQRVIDQYLVRVGDILVTEGGDIDKLGRGTVWEGEIESCIHQNHIFAVRVNKSVALDYFVSLAMGADYGRKYFTHTANKTTNLASTNRTKLGNFPIALPPPSEQKLIIDYANGINTRYGIVIANAEKVISTLCELKQTVVAEAVTGKIKL